MFKMAQQDKTGRWEAFHFSSMENPYISQKALGEITKDMTNLAYRMEILAEDVNEAPGALWTRADIEKNRVTSIPDFARVVVGVDPTATSGGDEAGIITAGSKGDECYTLADDSTGGSPQTWAKAAVTAYHRHKADMIVAEKNNGGEMVEAVIKQVDPTVRVKLVWASRGKATRAEPISAMSEQGRDHHLGAFPALEDELCLWIPGDDSPNRLDAKVWAYTELIGGGTTEVVDDPFAGW
jgi:phage terminase large subunit-like protein